MIGFNIFRFARFYGLLKPFGFSKGFGSTMALGSILLYGWPVTSFGQPDLEGIWGIDRTLFRQYSEVRYTEEGQRRHDAYDVLVDDFSYQCIPSGLGRAWDEPDTVVQIEQLEDRVVIQYEMFDLVRTVYLNQNAHPVELIPSTVNIHGEPMPTMGHSIGWYEGDTLMIETIGYARGNITTLLRYPPQSMALRSIERIYRDESDRLMVSIDWVDPITLAEPLVSTNRYLRSKFDLTVYGCIKEEFDHE